MKTTLFKLLHKGNITLKQHDNAINYFSDNEKSDSENYDEINNGWIEITESETSGYYDVQYSFYDSIFTMEHDIFKFTKEEYMTI